MNLREKKVAKKKEEILRSASKIISKHGYDRATMDSIAAELFMTKGMLYYYFANKEDLLYQCHLMVLTEASRNINDIYEEAISSTEKLRKAIGAHIELVISEKDTFNMISKPGQIFSEDHIAAILNQRDEYTRTFDKIIQQGIEQGEFVVHERKLVRMLILGALNWIQQWYSEDGEKSKEHIKEVYTEYLLKMLK